MEKHLSFLLTRIVIREQEAAVAAAGAEMGHLQGQGLTQKALHLDQDHLLQEVEVLQAVTLLMINHHSLMHLKVELRGRTRKPIRGSKG